MTGARLERFLLALLVLALFAGAIVVMSFFIVPEQNKEVVIQLVGGVNTLAGLVVGWYFGRHDREHVTVDNPPSDPIPVEQGRREDVVAG